MLNASGKPLPRPKYVLDVGVRRNVMRRLTRLETTRSGWWSDVQEIADYTNPRRIRRGSWDKDMAVSRAKILNDEATNAAQTTKAGLYAGVSSSSHRWFALTTPDPQLAEFGAVKLWLSDVTDRLYTLFAQSNTYLCLQEAYGDIVDFGNSPLVIDDDFDDVLAGTVLPPGEWLWFLNEKNGIGGVMREPTFTVEWLIRKYGYDNCSRFTKLEYDHGNYDTLVHCVEVWQKNDNTLPAMPNRPPDPFVRLMFEKGGEETDVLSAIGQKDWRICAARWDVRAGDVYAEGPGRRALADVKQLQSMERTMGGLMHLALRPGLDLPANGSSLAGIHEPGAIYKRGEGAANGAQARPIYTPDSNWYSALDMKAQRVEARIQRAYFADMFKTVLADQRNQRATAREIAEVHEEKMIQIGPALERMHSDFLSRLITIGFDRMADAGLLPEAPKELQQMQLKVRYTSVMAQAQQMVGVGSIERLAQFAGPWVAVKPDALDKIDVDQAFDKFADMAGVPVSIIRSDEAVAEIRQGRQAEMQKQAAAQQTAEMAAAGKTLAETDLTGDNALTRMISAGVGG